MPAKRRRRAIACLAAAAPTTKALRRGGLRRPRPPPSSPRAGAETVAEHIAEDPRHTEAMREEVVVSSAMTARECVRRDLQGNKIVSVAILLPWIEVSVGARECARLQPWQ